MAASPVVPSPPNGASTTTVVVSHMRLVSGLQVEVPKDSTDVWVDASYNKFSEFPTLEDESNYLAAFGAVTRGLSLFSNVLRRLNPSISLLPNLVVLRLDSSTPHCYNRLKSLPSEVGNLGALRELYLANNALTELPDALCRGCTSLVVLDVRSNSLSALPESFGNLVNLQTLNGCSNHLTTLPNSFSQLTALTQLYLTDNALRELPGPALTGLSSLRELGLANTKLYSLPSTTFSGMASLTAVNLGTNLLSSFPSDALEALAGSLVYLDLSDNRIDSCEGVDLRHFTSLETLLLDFNPCCSNGSTEPNLPYALRQLALTAEAEVAVAVGNVSLGEERDMRYPVMNQGSRYGFSRSRKGDRDALNLYAGSEEEEEDTDDGELDDYTSYSDEGGEGGMTERGDEEYELEGEGEGEGEGEDEGGDDDDDDDDDDGGDDDQVDGEGRELVTVKCWECDFTTSVPEDEVGPWQCPNTHTAN